MIKTNKGAREAAKNTRRVLFVALRDFFGDTNFISNKLIQHIRNKITKQGIQIE